MPQPTHHPHQRPRAPHQRQEVDNRHGRQARFIALPLIGRAVRLLVALRPGSRVTIRSYPSQPHNYTPPTDPQPAEEARTHADR